MRQYLDTSIIVKWFCKEPDSDRANIILNIIEELEGDYYTSEYSQLELVRALVKSKAPREDIELAFSSVDDLVAIGAIRRVPVCDVLSKAKDLEIALSLYASDAVHIASAIHNNCEVFWSADRHHLKKSVEDHAKKYGMKIRSLDDIV